MTETVPRKVIMWSHTGRNVEPHREQCGVTEGGICGKPLDTCLLVEKRETEPLMTPTESALVTAVLDSCRAEEVPGKGKGRVPS